MKEETENYLDDGLLNKDDDDPFHKINLYIEEQSDKDNYQESPDVYGTVNDYLEIILQYALLILFGQGFPLVFLLAFAWNVMELQTDKLKLFDDTQRPIPYDEQSIGTWNDIMVSFPFWPQGSLRKSFDFDQQWHYHVDHITGGLVSIERIHDVFARAACELFHRVYAFLGFRICPWRDLKH